MNPVVIISGSIREHPVHCIESMIYHFKNYDFFFGVWENEEILFKKTYYKYLKNNYYIISEPKIRYNCKTDTPHLIEYPSSNSIIKSKKNQIWKGNKINSGAIKQMIAHSYCLNKISTSYDMIIRLRYDVMLSKKVSFSKLLERSYNEKIAMGFASIFHNDGRKQINELSYCNLDKLPTREDRLELPHFLYDFMIFHRRDMFNTGIMHYLIDNKKLHCNEVGWYQLLSYPYDSNHECYHGGIQLARKLSL